MARATAVRMLGVGAISLAWAVMAAAEHAPRRLTATVAGGPVGFIEGSGVSAALTLGPRSGEHWRTDAEVDYERASPRESGLVLGVNLIRLHGRPTARVRPYWLVGLGYFSGRQNWSDDNGLTARVGAGVHVVVSRHVFVAPELRFGYVPRARAALTVGIDY